MDENNYYRLALTEVVHMDLPNDPCQAEGEYNFQACVKQALSNKVGCRTKWDRWSSEDVPVCTDLEQFMYVFVMIFLLKQTLCIKIDFYDNSWVLDFYDYESHKIIQINHFLIFTWSKKSLLDFYTK